MDDSSEKPNENILQKGLSEDEKKSFINFMLIFCVGFPFLYVIFKYPIILLILGSVILLFLIVLFIWAIPSMIKEFPYACFYWFTLLVSFLFLKYFKNSFDTSINYFIVGYLISGIILFVCSCEKSILSDLNKKLNDKIYILKDKNLKKKEKIIYLMKKFNTYKS